jgi:thioredoxin-related protein
MSFFVRGNAAIVVALLALAAVALPARAAELRDPGAFFTLNMGDLGADLAEARAGGKQGLLVMFEQEGCPGCAYMRRHVLSRADVQDYYRKHFINLSIDIHGSVPLKDAAGRGATEKSYAQSAKVRLTPTFVFYDLKGVEIVRFAGPLESAEEFILLGQFVATGAYKKSTFAQYRGRKPKGG